MMNVNKLNMLMASLAGSLTLASAAMAAPAASYRVYVTNAISPDTKSYAAFGQLNWHFTDTNETFVSMTGTWRASWENTKGEIEHVDLKPLDVISFPPGVSRRFENVTKRFRLLEMNDVPGQRQVIDAMRLHNRPAALTQLDPTVQGR